MLFTVLRVTATLVCPIALALGLLGGSAEPVHAQGFNQFGGMGGGHRRDDDRGGGGGNSGRGAKNSSRDGDGKGVSKQGYNVGPKQFLKDGKRGHRGERDIAEHGPKGKFADKIGRDGDRRGKNWNKIEGNGALDKRGRPKRDNQNADNEKPGNKAQTANGGNSRLPSWLKRHPKGDGKGTDQASNGSPAGSGEGGSKVPPGKYPWPNRDPKGDGKGTGQASTGTNPDGSPVGGGRYPGPYRNPKGTDQASTNPTGGGTTVGGADSECFDHCPGNPSPPTNNPPPTTGGGTGKPPQTGGGDDVPPTYPPCRGRNCGGDTGKPPQTGGGDDVPPTYPPCRGRNCDGGTGKPPQTGGGDDVPPTYPPCRGRNCDGNGRPPQRPPVIVIGPIGPLLPPPDYVEPTSNPPGYTPPNTATPVYEPAAPVRERPRQPERQANRTPPPSGALPSGPAPMPQRRAFATAQQPLYRPNEVLVTVQGDQPDAVAGQLAQSFNLVVEESQGFTLLPDRRVYRFRIPDDRGVDDVVATLATAPGVTQTLPNFYHYLQGSGGGDVSGLQYALQKLRVPETQDIVIGRGVTVAVIDSGVDTEHPTLQNANIQAYDAVNGGIKDPGAHGTAITGIIAGRGEVNGIAPGVTILAIRAFAPERQGAPAVTTSMALARATDIAVAKGARVVNMSFAGPRDDLLISLIDAAYDKGIVFIAAAGNQGPTAPPAYPAAYEKVIGITATDEDDGLYAMANRGNYISVAAPGVDILVPVVGNALDYMSGTSFAAAHISGIAALLMERNPKLGPEDIRQLLLSTAHNLGQAGYNADFGAGLADAYGAVSMAVGPKVQSSSINQ